MINKEIEVKSKQKKIKKKQTREIEKETEKKRQPCIKTMLKEKSKETYYLPEKLK